jgi:heme-degrading monooxygenase HmoA
MPRYLLAQLNIGRIVAPLDSPQLAGFVNRLDEINALADRAPGFVWRFQTAEGDATALRPFDDDRILVNFSVWESPEALQQFVYRTAHVEVMRQRREWFEVMREAYLVLWWVPAGHSPTVEEAIARLETLRSRGASPEAFTFRELFPTPESAAAKTTDRLSEECPAT